MYVNFDWCTINLDWFSFNNLDTEQEQSGFSVTSSGLYGAELMSLSFLGISHHPHTQLL